MSVKENIPSHITIRDDWKTATISSIHFNLLDLSDQATDDEAVKSLDYLIKDVSKIEAEDEPDLMVTRLLMINSRVSHLKNYLKTKSQDSLKASMPELDRV